MSEWTIPLMRPNQPNIPNPAALVGCKIIELPVNEGYMFLGPHGNFRSSTNGRPAGAFNFPSFRARLNNGGPEQEWFITVENLHTGELAWGYVSNEGFHHRKTQDEPDTWVAHAGATVEEDEGKCAAAASA